MSNEQYCSHIIGFEMYTIQYEILFGASVSCSRLKGRGNK